MVRDDASIDDALVILCGVLGAVSFWSTALAEIAGGLILGAAAARFLRSRRGDSPVDFCRGGLARLAFAFFVVYCVSVVLSVLGAPGTFLRNPSLIWHPLLLPALLFTGARRRALRRAACVFLTGGAACAVATLALDLGRGAGSEPFTFTGMTTFADLLVLACVSGMSLAFRRRPHRLPLAALAALLPAVAWSAERAPVLALAGVGTVRAARAGPRLLGAWLCIAAACAAFAPRAFTDKMDWMVRGGQIDRYVVWEEGLRMVPSVPLFGYGPGSFARVLPREAWTRFVQRPPASWHNDLLETWLDSGPLAAIALGGLVVLGIVQAARGLIPGARGAHRACAAVTGLLFAILVLFGMVGSVVTTSVLGLSFWTLLGLTINPPE